MDTAEPPQPLVYDSKMETFFDLVQKSSDAINHAARFEKELINWVKQRQGGVDKMFAWGIIPHCETSHDGMKKVFYKMGEAFQHFEIDKERRSCTLLEHWDKRRIRLVADALSARNFRCLKLNFIKKLTEIGTSKYVLPLLDSLK